MAFKAKPVVAGTTDTLVYECPAGTEGAAVLGVANTSGTAATYTLSFYSAALAQTIVLAEDVSVAANTVQDAYPRPVATEGGDKILVKASGADAITIFATVTQGNQGPQFTGITPKGAYSSTTTYAVNDMVSRNGSSYLSRAAGNLDNAPESSTAEWALLTSKGDQGDAGDAATIAVGSVTTLSPGQSATVQNSGSSAAAVFDFGIPQGDKGDIGDTGTIAVGTVTTLATGSDATVTNSGTSEAAVFDFGIPAGFDGEGSGDVIGPASSIDGNIVLFNGTSGKAIEDSGVSTSDFATAAQGALADSATQPEDLGNSAGLDVGTTAGTVAAGDHAHAHFTQTDNPHGVTKAQVGLGSVDNVSAASLRDRSTHTGSQAISTVTGLQAALDGKPDSATVNSIVVTDQTTYDGLTPDANTLYFITE